MNEHFRGQHPETSRWISVKKWYQLLSYRAKIPTISECQGGITVIHARKKQSCNKPETLECFKQTRELIENHVGHVIRAN